MILYISIIYDYSLQLMKTKNLVSQNITMFYFGFREITIHTEYTPYISWSSSVHLTTIMGNTRFSCTENDDHHH